MSQDKSSRQKRARIFARVSTVGQTTENQLRELRLVAERNGWEIVREFIDQGISGEKGKESRPQFNALHVAIARKDCDLVMAWSVDRLGRSLKDLVEFLGQVHAKGIGLYLHQQGLDTSTPAGKMLFGMMGVFAEFERSMIQEGVKAGIKRVRAKGQPWGRRKIEDTDPAVCTRMLELRRQGLGMAAIGKQVKLSSRTVWRFLRGVEASAQVA